MCGGSDDVKGIAYQAVNPDHARPSDKMNEISEARSAFHEVLEWYNRARHSPGAQPPTFDDVANKTSDGLKYLDAHNDAMTTDPRFKPQNSSQGSDGIYISKFPYSPNIPPVLNPELLLFKFKK